MFATAFDQYAVRAFEVNAIDYLLKPFEKKRIALAVEKVRMRRAKASASQAETDIEAVPRASAEERLESLLKLLETAGAGVRRGAAETIRQGGGACRATITAGGSAGNLFCVD